MDGTGALARAPVPQPMRGGLMSDNPVAVVEGAILGVDREHRREGSTADMGSRIRHKTEIDKDADGY